MNWQSGTPEPELGADIFGPNARPLAVRPVMSEWRMLSAAGHIVQREEAAGRSWRTAIPVIVQELGVSPLCACRLAAGLTAEAVLGLLSEWELGPPSLEAWELMLTVPSPLAAFALGLIYRVPPDLLGVPADYWHEWRSQRRAGQHPRS